MPSLGAHERSFIPLAFTATTHTSSLPDSIPSNPNRLFNVAWEILRAMGS